ncbi:hypothetical protein KJ780_00625 [Candidatus Micrarchaeota archaeon]|nr:hypothetical protein [Candidatus Micrarchaeota archaeon]
MGHKKSSDETADFKGLVESIRSAESESEHISSDYGKKVTELSSKGRERLAEMKENYQKKAEEVKNDVLSKGIEENEVIVQETIEEARKQVGKLGKKQLSPKDLETVFNKFVSLM